ncbi:MAG TPA: ACT domain-containing protein [Candidatus Bipolaricaulota bacterium]
MKEFRVKVVERPGQLALVKAALSQKLTDIHMMAGLGSAGPLITFIAENEAQARATLKELGLSYEEVEILTVILSDQPGELAKLARKLGDANININSIHVLGTQNQQTKVALTVSDAAKAKQVLGLR